MKKVLVLLVALIFVTSLSVEAKEGWQTVKGKTYYYKNNVKVKGYQKIDGKLYYFYCGNKALRKGWQKTSNGLFYSNSKGVVPTGWTTINGKKYYFNTKYPYNAYLGNHVIDGNKYYFYYNGILRTGWQKSDKGLFYSNSKGIINTGWQTINKKKYYFNPSYPYNAYFGYHTIDGNIYYFYYNGILRTGWQTANNKSYYSDSNGIVQRGWQTIAGKKYYFNKSYPYEAYKGPKRVDGNLYYFDPITLQQKIGWAGYDTSYYHSEADGILNTGLVTIGDTKYKFDSNGKVVGFSKKNNKIYYTNPDGKLLKGTVRMCNRNFKFDEVDGHFVRFVNRKAVIDVSQHQGNIDWKKVKYSGQVDAVIVRIGYGDDFEDTKFERNITELKKYNIPFSIYLFSYSQSEAQSISEARFVYRTLAKYRPKLYKNIPIFYDLEYWKYTENGKTITSSTISDATYGKMIKAFITESQRLTQKKTRVYASRDYIRTHFPTSYQNYATWVACWSNSLNYDGPYEGWQYSNVGKVSGISGSVDLSWFYY